MKTSAGISASDNIAERMRIEETRAQLAAARQGMERQAAAAAQEKAQKEKAAAEKAAAAATTTGGRWVAPHMRNNMPSRLPGAKLDTASEELFPDLQQAAKQQTKKTAPVVKIPKKTPVGGGATWASKPKIAKASSSSSNTPAAAPKKKEEKQEEKPFAEEPKPVQQKQEQEPPKAAQEAPAAAALPAVPKITRKTTKKKKKDLSTFKPSGGA